jgi:hypothetical protein
MPGSRIFKVEDLGEAWPMVCDEVETRSGIRLPPIGRRNVGKSGIPWVSIYDDRSRRMVERIYSRDFETFGYAYSQAPGR